MRNRGTAKISGTLQAAIIHGDAPDSRLPDLLKEMSHLKVMAPNASPESLGQLPPDEAPDLVLVDLDGSQLIPEWLEGLTHSLPHTAILVCTSHREPDFLIRGMQCGVREFLPLPLTRPELEAAVKRVRVAQGRLRGEKPPGRVAAVTSHKGGAGCTAIAINLAVALAEMCPEQVALLDLGRPFPDVENFLDQEVSHSLLDLTQNLHHLDPVFVQKTLQSENYGLAIIHGSPDFQALEVIASEGLGKLFQILRSLYDWIIVDLSHWPDEVYRRVIQDVDELLLITELTVPDMRNLKRMKLIFQNWGVAPDKLKVLVNRYIKDSGLNLAEVERILGQPPFATLPSDYGALLEAVNQGVPLTVAAPRSKLCRALQGLARRLAELYPSPSTGSRPQRPRWFNFLHL